MPFEWNPGEKDLLVWLLEKEIEDIRTEIRHTSSHDYKDGLKVREQQILNLLERLKG
ncbi:MAG: hypothetical protein ABFD80_01540 [Acidobacteriota bacterium]